MFDEKKYLTNTINLGDKVPFSSEQGKKSVYSFANYSTEMVAVEAMEELGMRLNIVSGVDLPAIRKEFLADCFSLPIKVINPETGEMAPRAPASFPPVIAPYGPKEENDEDMGVIIFEDGNRGKLKITRTVNNGEGSDPLVSNIVLTYIKWNDDKSKFLTRIIIPVKFDSQITGTIGKARVEHVYYNKDSMELSFTSTPTTETKSDEVYSDDFEKYKSYMDGIEIFPDASKSEEVEPVNPEFSPLNANGLTEFTAQLISETKRWQKEVVESKTK